MMKTVIVPWHSQLAPDGSAIPHRPQLVIIQNHWGAELFHAVRYDFMAAGIGCQFQTQTREEAERECAEAGIDPDGFNLFFGDDYCTVILLSFICLYTFKTEVRSTPTLATN